MASGQRGFACVALRLVETQGMQRPGPVVAFLLVKISERIKNLFGRQPPLTREELAPPTDEERRREHEADLTAQIEAEKLRTMRGRVL